MANANQKYRSPQISEVVETLKTRDDMVIATDEVIQVLSNLMMQLDFARNRMVEGLDLAKMVQVGELYEQIAIKVNDVAGLVVRVARTVQAA